MDKTGNGQNLESFLSILLEEVIKADISMQDRQIEAWKHFSDYKPVGDLINEDIDKGWAKQRYLTLDEVKFKFHVRLVRKNFFARFRQGMNYIFGSYNPHAFEPSSYIITESETPDSVEVTVKVRQEERGKIKVDYEPVDAETKRIFLNSPFLQKRSK